MSHILWKYYLEHNVDKFEALLSANGNQQSSAKGYGGNVHVGSLGAVIGSPATGNSPRINAKTRKSSGFGIHQKSQTTTISRADINSRDSHGCTILHLAASSVSESATRFAIALIDHSLTDIYIQDFENGWTALHRACYFGNIIVARQLLARDLGASPLQSMGSSGFKGNSLIKIKDFEGNTAFDVYNATIARRTLEHHSKAFEQSIDEDDDHVNGSIPEEDITIAARSIDGDELFAFGSNKNLTLGFGDQDDRQYPERVSLKRPDHLLRRFYREHLAVKSGKAETLFSDVIGTRDTDSVLELPVLIRNKPLVIDDVVLSKLHSAVLTNDPESNLHMCGFGSGGRLGTGDETTRFSYVCVEGGSLAGKKVASVALGLHHTLALSSEGEVSSWGTNTYGQLGYSLPRSVVLDEEPYCNSPRQIFGPLKKELIVGIAASGVHSVAHTSSALFTWGKNNGQLGLMDSDSRSLDAQTIPRRVAASLFSSSIEAVSAIDRATVVLLANHSVCVFTNYGYNFVKFPLYEGFAVKQLNALTTRYEADAHITSVTANGDTIAALSSRGDLFTVSVAQNPAPSAASTTNPSKIKNALSTPQRIWALRKGNWDGVQSVSVSENGAVIICTRAGAVYRRIKRVKVKDAFNANTGEAKKKDYKFQRVPGLTNIVAVRASAFGTYAAIRKDCDVTRTQVTVAEQSLWKDVSSLFSLRGFVYTEPPSNDEGNRFWTPALPKEHFDPFKRGVLLSPELERDVLDHVKTLDLEEFDVDIGSTISDAIIPCHSFILAARSFVLREAFEVVRELGSYDLPEVLIITSMGNRMRIQFQGVDFITILNLVQYTYEDDIVDVWHFTRHAPKSAFRFRQVRTELMKVAGKLKMANLEAAARSMIKPDPRLNIDFAHAIRQESYFDAGDTVIELDGDEMRAHSAILRKRCPFFDGLFGGRSDGQWLAARRDIYDDVVRIDLKHIDPSIFDLVLRHIYADIGAELFDEVVADDLDEFSEVVMDVLAVANELMLDRLSQICQHTLARFVNTRNICHLLNAIAPVAVTDFKNAGLEYLCLQLEAILEGQLLDDLDETLLDELNEVIRDNQLTCSPFARSGRAELLLHERHPTLAEELDSDRQRRIRDLAFRAQTRDEDSRLSSSFKNRIGSIDDMSTSSPQDKDRRKSKSRNTPFSPALRPKDSNIDLMFDMDDDDQASMSLASPRGSTPVTTSLSTTAPVSGITTPIPISQLEAINLSRQDNFSPREQGVQLPTTPAKQSQTAVPWSAKPLSSTKLDMRDIMAQADNTRGSSLSMGLSLQKTKDDANAKPSTPKLSQKERKRQQQQALQNMIAQPQYTLDDASPSNKSSSPWQVATGAKTSLKDVLNADVVPRNTSPSVVEKDKGRGLPPLDIGKHRTASPDTRFAGQQRRTSAPVVKPPASATPARPGPSRPASSSAKSTPLIPHSKSYNTGTVRAEPSLQLSMADIIGQQKREQDLIKEAVAKRSLQEIQDEQTFQEWWDLESRRAQEEEAIRLKNAEKANAPRNKASRRGGKAGGKGKGGGGSGVVGGSAHTEPVRENATRGRDKAKPVSIMSPSAAPFVPS